MRRVGYFHAFGIAAAVLGAAAANAQTFLEAEANDSKAAANVLTMGAGFFTAIQGNSTASTAAGLDYFRVKTAADALGIYRYTLTIDSQTPGHTGNIRGLNQVAAAAGTWPGPVGTPGTTDSTLQTHYIPVGTTLRVNTWYGFGKEEEIYYRVTGTTSTTADYVASFAKVAIAPTNIGNFQPGSITISSIGMTSLDTEFWVYDSTLTAIPGYGNDDESANGGGTGATAQSILTRNYAAGTYYLAVSRFNMANNQGSPCDDDFRTGAMLDFKDAVTSSSTTASATLMNFKMTDSLGSPVNVTGPAYGVLQHEVQWYSFNVVPEPATLAVFVIGAAGLALRRRRK